MSDTTAPIPQPPTPDTHRAPKRRRWPWVIAILVALFVGVGIGMSGADESTSAGGVVTETVTETETVEVAPQSCLDALDAAEAVIHQGAVPAFDIVVKVLDAAANFDVAGMEDATAELDVLTPITEALVESYNEHADACREAAN